MKKVIKNNGNAVKIISIVIPAWNEKEGIVKTIQAIPKDRLQEIGYRVQVLVVDGNSNDGTIELAREAGAEVVIEPIRGYGRAYKTGFARADGDIIATADADGTYPIEDIPQLVKSLEEEKLDFITTNRFPLMEEGAMSLGNRVGNGILTLVMRLLFGIDIKDSQSGMWVFRRRLLDKAVMRFDTMAFSEELKIEACHFCKGRWKEVPIEYRARVGEIKLQRWVDGFRNLFSLFKKRVSRGK
ncbi:glycosyltransferase family 2 protein [Chloroflexota bacterium]